MPEIIGGRFVVLELVAVSWDSDMAARFPNEEHHGCRALREHQTNRVTRCVGWHCNRCGQPTNSYGHHNCPDRPEADDHA